MRKIVITLVILLLTACVGDTSSTSLRYPAIVENGKSLDWCRANDLITYEKLNGSYYDVYTIRPDGSNEKCLTNNSKAPQKHNGNPVWHPSTKYIVFTAQNEDATCKECDDVAIPGRGVNCNLWVMTSDGKTYWQLTSYPTTSDPKGVIHPQFSNSGKKLMWAERLKGKKGTPWGEWALKVADFVIDGKGPRLENIRTYQPGEAKRFYESHAFSKDDTKILFSGNLVSGQLESGLDIYEMDLKTQKVTRLTSTFDDWDEHAHYSPDGEKIAWMSSTDLGDLGMTFDDIRSNTWGLKLRTELWIMDKDGSHKQRLTFFNERGSPDYLGNQVIVSDSTWSPDGTKIAATVVYKEKNRYKSKVLLIEVNLQKLQHMRVPFFSHFTADGARLFLMQEFSFQIKGPSLYYFGRRTFVFP